MKRVSVDSQEMGMAGAMGEGREKGVGRNGGVKRGCFALKSVF